MIYEISVLILSIAFVVLVIYLVFSLIALRQTLKNLNQTITEYRVKLGPLTESSNELMENVLHKARSLDTLFNSISNVGCYLEDKTTVLKDIHERKFKKMQSHSQTADWIELAALGVLLWQKYRKGE